MRSTFMGLETARRSLTTHQWALQATGNNIANASTQGYSRQRLTMGMTEQLTAALGGGRLGQFGTGVRGDMLTRIRDAMVDQQYRDESVNYSYYATKETAFGRMEDIINEPTENGLAKSIDLFWGSLEDLSVHPEDSGARSVVRQRALTLTQTLNYMAGSLSKVRTDLKDEASVVSVKVNDLLDKLNNINQQIGEVEPLGVLPNDLYDERDRYMDELAQYVNFKKVAVDYTNGSKRGNSQAVAEGRFDIVLVDPSDATKTYKVVDGLNGTAGSVALKHDAAFVSGSVSGAFEGLDVTAADGTTTTLTFAGMPSGKLRALVEMHGYKQGTGVSGAFAMMLKDLDEVANVFAQAFNAVHATNKDMSGNAGVSDFFINTATASGIGVNDQILSDLNLIAASRDGNVGDGSGALALARVKSATLSFNGSVSVNTTVGAYYQSVIGNMAVSADQSGRLAESTGALMMSADQRRQAVSAVSLDEEMTMMIQYQHAYNAAARNITTVDEMLDKIINGMGVVGR